MNDELHRSVGRRQFLKGSEPCLVAMGGLLLGRETPAQSAEDAPNTHNMLVFGRQAIFLSHLPMLHRLRRDADELHVAAPLPGDPRGGLHQGREGRG